jgi:DNA-binding beta-propeller fold protein YncE
MKMKIRAAAAAAILSGAIIATGLAAAPALASTTAPVVSGGGSHPVAVAFNSSGSTAYVIDQLAVINVDSTSSKKVSHYIDTPDTAGYNGGGALSPDGKTLYVSTWDGLGGPSLLAYSTSTRKLKTTLSIPGQTAGAVAITPDGTKALVWVQTAAEPDQDQLDIVTLSTDSVATVNLGNARTSGQAPSAIAVTANSATAYVTTYTNGVAAVTLSTSDVTYIATESVPNGLALDPATSKLYIAETDGTIEEATAGSSNAPTTFTLLDGFQASSLALTNITDKYLVISGSSTTSGEGVALVFAAGTGDFVSQTIVGSSPWAVAVSPTDTKAYVANNASGTTSIVTLKNAAPTISSHTAPTTGTVNTDYSTQFSASGFPSPTYTSTGDLPQGLTLDTSTGLLHGQPTEGGVFKFKIVASNSSGKPSSSKTQTVTIKQQLSVGEPNISGSVGSGQTLTLDPGTWGPSPVTLKYQWYRQTSPGSTWKTISGATKLTYKIPSKYASDQFEAVVTGTKSGYTTAKATAEIGTIE